MSRKLIQLARSFPTLADAPLDPWDPVSLDTWATGPVGTSGLRHAAAFVLSVWSVPVNVAATVRKQLCREVLGVLEGCDQRAYQAEETAPPLLRRRIEHARQKALFAWRSYQLGQLADAREAAAAAASLDEVYAPLARSLLAAGGPLSKPEVLQMLAEAEVWRVGAFNAGAALAVWDASHRDVFLTWARAPWYC